MKLTHLGMFSLPPGPQAVAPSLSALLRPYARFGYGGQALCMSDTPGHLWVSGHDTGDLVAEVEIPQLSSMAQITLPFLELASRAALSDAHLDQLVGVAVHNGTLHGLYQDFYDVDGSDGGRASLWDGTRLVQLGTGRLKTHAGYMTVHDGLLWVGRSHGAGNADINHGPSLWRVSGLSLRESFQHTRPDWTKADRYTAVAFLPGCVCWLVSKAVGTVWYGGPVGPAGEVDAWNPSKGYHTSAREVWLLPYTLPEHKELPPIRLVDFHASGKCGGMAFDPGTGRLYIHEAWPPEKDHNYPWERPRVHVYQVEAATNPEPDRERITVRVTIDGTSYSGSIEKEDE